MQCNVSQQVTHWVNWKSTLMFCFAGGWVEETPSRPKGSPLPRRGTKPGMGRASVLASASTCGSCEVGRWAWGNRSESPWQLAALRCAALRCAALGQSRPVGGWVAGGFGSIAEAVPGSPLYALCYARLRAVLALQQPAANGAQPLHTLQEIRIASHQTLSAAPRRAKEGKGIRRTLRNPAPPNSTTLLTCATGPPASWMSWYTLKRSTPVKLRCAAGKMEKRGKGWGSRGGAGMGRLAGSSGSWGLSRTLEASRPPGRACPVFSGPCS